MEINRHYRTIKSALRKGNLSGSFVGAKYRFSPYMACQHGCLYCDGRAEKYYVEGEFDRDIIIRSNLPDVLAEELPRLREKGVISIGSGVSDAYQPVEAEEKIMRRCAGVLSNFSHPAAVLTKSSLIARDLDVWSAVQAKGGFLLLVSLVFADDENRSIFEPRASSVEERIDILKAFKQAGCRTALLAMPIIPLIADSERDIHSLYERAAGTGVDFIMPGSLTLRPGRQKETFMRLISDRFPEQLEPFRDLYSEDRLSGVPRLSYRKELQRRFSKVQREFGLPCLLPHSLFREKVHVYDEVNILLHHMLELYSDRGIAVHPLRNALDNYMEWLKDRKARYNRRRSWSYAALDQELVDLLRSGEMESLIGNRKLTGFLEDIVIHRKTFDYVTLSVGDITEPSDLS